MKYLYHKFWCERGSREMDFCKKYWEKKYGVPKFLSSTINNEGLKDKNRGKFGR